MRRSLALCSFVVTLVVAAGSAQASPWTHAQEFKYAKTASIRIVEPEGFKVRVDQRTDSVPAVFKFANEANYHSVTVTAPDGTSWTKKIEVKASRETVLRVRYAAKAKDQPKAAPAGKTYIGNVKNTCRRAPLRFEFMLDGTRQSQLLLKPRQDKDVTVPSGEYQVRVYQAVKNKWKYLQNISLKVTADGWKLAPRC